MKKKLIKEPVYESYFWLVWDCDIYGLRKWVLKTFEWELTIRDDVEHLGKTITITTDKNVDWIIWINDKKNVESLAHELFHMTGITMKNVGITITENDEPHAYF